MRVLLDTHLLIWIAVEPERLSTDLKEILARPDVSAAYSVASLWEVAIKQTLRKRGLGVHAAPLRKGLTSVGLVELPIVAEHVLAVASLDRLHGDPFDRLLVAQSLHEGRILVTADAALARYPAPVKVV